MLVLRFFSPLMLVLSALCNVIVIAMLARLPTTFLTQSNIKQVASSGKRTVQKMRQCTLSSWLLSFFLLEPVQGYVRRRVEAKLINWPFSPLRLASWLRTANIGSLTADPHPNHVVNFNQAKVIMAFARARPTSKGRKGRSPKPWFSNGIMVLNSKKRALFFSAGE